MAEPNEAGPELEDDLVTIEEQLAIQELTERERAAEREMRGRLRYCKWLSLDHSLWGAQWSRARLASESESLAIPPVAADGEECCPVCLYPPLPQQRVALDCCKTNICQVRTVVRPTFVR